MRSTRCVKRAIAAFPLSPKRARNICFHSIEDYGDGWDGAKYVMTPPLREKHNHAELWKGLKMDDLQVISTDHCPFCMKEQKELGKDDFSKIPNGAPGVENRMSLIYNGGVVENRISLNRFVELTSTAAAKMFGLFRKKGRSPSAPTPTSSSSIRKKNTLSASKTNT